MIDCGCASGIILVFLSKGPRLLVQLRRKKVQKISVFSLLLCFFSFCLFTDGFAQAEPGTVVMEYTLGMHLDSVPKQNLLKMGRFQKLWRYDRVDENLVMNGIRIAHVRLFFWDNALHSVEIKTQEGDGDKMLAWLKSVYGAGRKEDAMGYRYSFFLPTMRVIWDENMALKQGVAEFIDEKTNDKYWLFMETKERRSSFND